jgi:hypothetical protein
VFLNSVTSACGTVTPTKRVKEPKHEKKQGILKKKHINTRDSL